jgi:hypothetical protein
MMSQRSRSCCVALKERDLPYIFPFNIAPRQLALSLILILFLTHSNYFGTYALFLLASLFTYLGLVRRKFFLNF